MSAIPRNSEVVFGHSRREFARVFKHKDPEMEREPWIIQVGPV